MAIAIVILLLVIGSLIFHFVSPWWFTPLASNWQAIDNTINVTFWVTGFVFVAVNCFLAYVVMRYRYNKNRRSDYQPENKKLEGWLTFITTIGVAAMLAPGLVVWAQFVTVPEQASVIEAVGQQWHWSFRLPGKDGKLGKTAIELVNQDNPFGIDPKDLAGQDDILVKSNELHLPINQAVKVLLRSKDVLHNFTVPQFRVKMDLVPGLSSYLWFTPTKFGRFEILCEELCGVAHYTMRGHVVVESSADYQTWLVKQTTFEQSLNAIPASIAKGSKIYIQCMACHGDKAQGNKILGAPQLAGQAKWYLERQLKYYKNHIRGNEKSDTYGQQMALMTASLVDDTVISEVAAYLSSLPSSPVQGTTKGNITKGQELYENCAYCHGKSAQGNYALNAPKLSDQYEWYLKRQIVNYQKKIRGDHVQDLYGSQMIFMSKLLQSDQAINDVTAYIVSLE